jgi:hypothetical protein
MTNTFKRGLIASAAVGSVVMALVMSGGASQARQAYQDGINNDGTVVCDGQAVGQDPDRHIQMQLYRDCGRTNGDGGGTS